MTKQEIMKAIENSETVWNKFKQEIDFSKIDRKKIYVYDTFIQIPSFFGCGGLIDDYYFSDLYKTKEDAEFVAKNWCSRTERFEPPLWGKISNIDKFEIVYTFCEKDPTIDLWYTMHLFVDKSLNVLGLRIENSPRDYIVFPYCKENYIKAVEYARKLFKGESV